MNIRDSIIFYQKKNNLSNKELCDKCNIPLSSYALYRTGKRGLPYEYIDAILDEFNLILVENKKKDVIILTTKMVGDSTHIVAEDVAGEPHHFYCDTIFSNNEEIVFFLCKKYPEFNFSFKSSKITK